MAESTPKDGRNILALAAISHESEADMLLSIKAVHGEAVYEAARASCNMFKDLANLLTFAAHAFPVDARTAMIMALLEDACRRSHARASVLLLRTALKELSETQLGEVCRIIERVNESHMAFLKIALPIQLGGE